MEKLCKLINIKSLCMLVLVVCLAPQTSSQADPQQPETDGSSQTRGAHLELKEGAVMGNYEAGQTQVMNIERDSRDPRYGSCWTNALHVVTAGCKRLTDDEQSRMALTLANCHLAKAGIETHPCDEFMSIQECLGPIKNNAISFNAYTEFFTHTQDICFFLQSQVWHEHTEQTVEKLAQHSEDVAEQLEVAGRLQESMIQQQGISLQNQEQILAQEAQLKDALKTSTNNIQEVFAEMKSSTLEQKALFAETFDRVAQVQKLMLGEFTWFNSVIYFVIIIILSYVVTSTPRTAGARFGLFLLFLLNWITEWMLFQFSGSNDQTLFHTRTWLCRKIFCLFGFLFLVFKACRYHDYNQINHAILLQIQDYIQKAKLDGTIKTAGITAGAIFGSHVNTPQPIAPPRVLPAIKNASKTEFSSDSSDADATFRPENLASSDSHDSNSLDHSYLAAEHTVNRSSISKATLEMDDLGSSAKRRRGRPKGSKNRVSRESSPVVNTSRFQSPYNLRQRGPHQSPRSPNPVLDLETSIMFAQHVEDLASRHYIIQPTINLPSRERVQPGSGALSRGRGSRSRSPGKSVAPRASFFSSDED